MTLIATALGALGAALLVEVWIKLWVAGRVWWSYESLVPINTGPAARFLATVAQRRGRVHSPSWAQPLHRR